MSGLRSRCRRDEQGVTLLELVVVVLLLGIVGTILLNFLDNTTSVTARATSNVVKENEGRQAMRELTQDVRAANKIASSAPSGDPACPASTFPSYPGSYKTCLRFEIQRSVDATQACPKSVITYGLANGVLRKSRIDYAANCSTITRQVTGRTVATGVRNAAATPLFEYFNSANQPITGTASTDIPLYVKAASIRVNLLLQYKKNAPDINITSAVALRNNR